MPTSLKLLFLDGTAERSLFEMAGDALAGALPGVEPVVVRAPSVPIAQLPQLEALAQPWDFVLFALTAELGFEGVSIAERAQILSAQIEALQNRGTVVALATLFRHVPAEHPRRRELRLQIRELNLMVRKLSHERACFVLDLDRELAHEGALKLGADCFGGGELAAEVALSELMVLALEMLGDRIPEVAA